MSKHNTTPRTLSRRLVALLAALALLAAMALPVYAETQPEPPVQTEPPMQTQETVETDDKSKTSTGAESEDTNDNASSNTTGGSNTTAGDSANGTPQTLPDGSIDTTAGKITTNGILDTMDEEAKQNIVTRSIDNAETADDETADDMALYDGVTTDEYFDIYFALPKAWEGAQKISFQGMRGNTQPHDGYSREKTMMLVDDANKTTKDGKKVYKVTLYYKKDDINEDIDCSYGGFAKITFKKDDDTASVISAKLSYDGESTTQFWQKYGDLKDRYYDSDKQEWISIAELKPRHTHFADKTFTFKNMTNDLTNVQAIFYDKAEGSTELTQVKAVDFTVSAKENAIVTIPNDACAYVAFFVDGKQVGKCFNFCNDDSTTANVTPFLYSESQNCFVYTTSGNSGNVGLPEDSARKIYYDATFSKLDAENPDHAIPNKNGEVYYHLWCSNDSATQDGKMVKANDTGNLYVINNVDSKYDHIIFSNNAVNENGDNGHGSRTGDLTIPSEETCVDPCFYADTSDDATYDYKNKRGGYWAKVNTLRDAEAGKSTDGDKKDVVAIQKGTFVADPATKYISTTLYDYYTDYELNGNSRTKYIESEGGNHRNWVTFREFDQAISDYYESYDEKGDKVNKILYPIYTGHFQPSVSGWGNAFFAYISKDLNLYGFDPNTNSAAYKAFRAANNSAGDEKDSEKDKYDFAFQGIVANTLSESGDLLMNVGTKTDSGVTLAETTLVEPHFNESFLSGTNSKNAKLGEVYHNVSFPLTKKQIFSDEPGVDYWWYDSSKTSLYLRQDKNSNALYLGNNGSNGKTAGITDNRSYNLDSAGLIYNEYRGDQKSGVNTRYGFFPFNESLERQDGVASQYNYGYGAKLEIPFSITSDGKVESKDEKGNIVRVPIRYYFSGDDDVWVFIDNQLVLDIGGAHGKVSGILDFSQTESQKNFVTAYVSQVKCNKYVVKGYGPSEENNGKQAEITYTINPNDSDESHVNTTPTTYYQKNPVEIEGLTTGTHTLTMYYMERGMWESNMAVAFNFPDHNELQVQKVVNADGVNSLFKNCFTDKRLFNFTIRNQATHYGATATANDNDTVTTINLLQPGESTPEQKNFTTTTDTGGENRFTKVTDPPNYLNVTAGTPLLKWYAEFEDLTPSPGSKKDDRYGILKLDGDQTIDISDMSYLSFDIYVDSTEGDAALSNMYLQLRDSSDRKKGCLDKTFIGGKALYGQVEMHNRQWVTVKLSLDDMKTEDNFDKIHVKELRFGCNYPRSIYLRNIVFSSKAVPQTVTGFTTKQEDIADYGSADSGKLMPAKNAQYTSDAEQGTMVVDGNGGFVLKAGETISFKDQFRRGSYLSINEQVDTNLFDTHWTIYEDGKAVERTKAGGETKLTLDGDSKNLENQPGTAPDDGRIEKKYAEDENAQNNNIYDGTKPSKNGKNDANDNTIVFRSYANPDAKDVDGETKLKVVFVNTVKTGSLTIKKEQGGKGENLTGVEYKFIVRFTNVGGHALEDKAIVETYTAKVGEPCVINDIPVGTRFTIQEVPPKDGSKLMRVSVTGGGSDTTVLNDNTVRGSIVAGDERKAVATFINTKQDLLDITGTKVWKNADNTNMTGSRPTIYVQLQRRHKKTQGEQEAWQPVPYQNNKDYLPVINSYDGMTFRFLGQPAKDYSETDMPNFEYQVVEGYLDNEGVFHAVGDNGTIKIDEKVYSVAYTVSNTAATNNSNAKQTVTIINKQQDPKFTLDITKADAEKTSNHLKGVEFTLERLTTDSTGKMVVDKKFAKRTGVTNDQGVLMLTDSSGNATETRGFTELEAGTYQLTETKAAKDYNLLSAPIIITFTKEGTCQIGTSTADDKIFTGNAVKGYTLKLTVLNRKTPTLPHTGADAPSLWLLIGLPLAVAGLLILVFRYNKKGDANVNCSPHANHKQMKRGKVMQKKSRFLTGLLSAVMALTLFALPATAEGDAVTPTIDTSRTGSLTINKYEGNDPDVGKDKPLNGVEFTLYKVADIVQTTTAPIEVNMVPVTQLTEAAKRLNTTITIDKDTTYNTIANVVNEALNGDENGKNKLVVAGTQTTQTTTINGESKDGVAQFKDLAVGVYLVVETDAPPQIVNHSANFLVSIPMMNSDGKSWNYNIEANPKNTAYYGGITLTKYGKEGSKNETALGGASFVLQQYDATANKWNTLTSKDNAKLTTDGILTTSTESASLGQIHVENLQPGKYRFIEVSAPDGSGYIVDGETAYEFEVKVAVDGTITYAINSDYKDGNKDAIKVVNEKPDLTKTVYDAKKKSYAKDADFSVGDKVTWKVEATVPSKVDKLGKFELVDQMSKALDLNAQTSEIKVVASKENVTLEKGSDKDYTVDVVGATGEQGPKWTIAFTQAGKKKLADNKVEKITVEFDTTLNSKAVISTAGNLNKAQLNYTNAFYPSSTDKPDYPDHPEPKTDVVKDEAIVYTFGMSINKVDGKTNDALQGAKFDLYKWTAAKVPADVKEADLKNAGNATKVRTGLKSDNNGKVVDESGKPLYFSNGDYFLVETEAPVDENNNHYNLLKEPVKVELNVVYTTTTQTTYTGETNVDGSVTVKATTVTNTTFNEKNDKGEGIVTITVKNNKGFDLPVTGGFGTLLFSGIGALLVVGGVGVLMGTKKKKDNA